MSEDEAIEILKIELENTKRANECGLATKGEFDKQIQAIESILDSYQQEKEKNKNLIKQLQEQNTEIQDISKQLREKEQENIKMRSNFLLSLNDFILKDKIRAFIKKETFEGRYSFDLISAKRLQKLLSEDKENIDI